MLTSLDDATGTVIFGTSNRAYGESPPLCRCFVKTSEICYRSMEEMNRSGVS